MEFSAKQIAAFIQGEIIGDENATYIRKDRRRNTRRYLFPFQSEIYTLYI